MEIKINEDQIIRKHNRIVESKYANLTEREKKLFAIVISQIKKDDESFDTYQIPANEIKKVLDLDSESIYEQLKEVANRLYNRSFMIEVPGKSWELFRFVDKAMYKEGFLYIKLHNDLAPFLLNLYKDYTPLQLGIILSLKGTHTLTIYEWLKKWVKIQKKTIPLSELKEKLGVHEVKSYDNFADFKKRILEPAIKEINEKSDLYFTYEPKKEKQKVTSLIFTILLKNEIVKNDIMKSKIEKTTDDSNQTELEFIVNSPDFIRNEDLVSKIKEIIPGLLESKIIDLVNKSTDDQILNAINITEKYKQKDPKANLPGLFVKAMNQGWLDYKTEKVKKDKEKKEIEEKELKAKKQKEESSRIWDEFLAMPEDEKFLIIGQVIALKGDIIKEHYREKGLNSMLVKTNILVFIKQSRGMTES